MNYNYNQNKDEQGQEMTVVAADLEALGLSVVEVFDGNERQCPCCRQPNHGQKLAA